MATYKLVDHNIWITQPGYYGVLENTGCLLQSVQCLMSNIENFIYPVHIHAMSFLLP